MISLNLSSHPLTPAEASVLSKGLSFSPTPSFSHFRLVADAAAFARQLRWKYHWSTQPNNLIYQLQCKVCSAFYIGETRRSLSDHMNGHRFTIIVTNPDLPVAIHTQSHQIPFQDCWSVSLIHKLPDSTPDHIRRQCEIAYQLVLQSCHTPGLNIR